MTSSLKCFFCGQLMSWLRSGKRTKWRNQEWYEMEDVNLFWCDHCKIHWWNRV